MNRMRENTPTTSPQVSARAPSRAQFPLRSPGQPATAVEAGGAIRSYTAAGLAGPGRPLP